jgi:pimeloyl-ACP methyl ester carboxylesterase
LTVGTDLWDRGVGRRHVDAVIGRFAAWGTRHISLFTFAHSAKHVIHSLDVGDTLAVTDRLPSLGVPARLVWGVADPFQKVQYGERFAGDLKAQLHRIDQGRHFTPEDHPDVIAGNLNALVSATRG